MLGYLYRVLLMTRVLYQVNKMYAEVSSCKIQPMNSFKRCGYEYAKPCITIIVVEIWGSIILVHTMNLYLLL